MNGNNKNSIIQTTFSYAYANYLSQAIGILNSILLRRWMGPAGMGVWSIVQIILSYCGYASFGTTKAMARDYPFLRGKGEHEKAEQLKDLVLTFSMVMSFVPALIIIAYLAVSWRTLAEPLKIGLLFLSVFLFVQRFYDLMITLLRSDKKFGILSQVIVLNAVATLLVSIILVRPWNIYGLYLGTAITLFICLFFIIVKEKYQFHLSWDPRAVWNELKLGIPLLAASFLSESLRNLDRMIIAKYLTFTEVGLYSIAIMAASYVISFPMMFAHVWYPNLQETFGKNETAESIKQYLLKPVFTLAVLCPFLCGLGFFLVPIVTHLFIPKFAGGIVPMKIYLVGTFFLLLAQFSSNFLITLNKYLINLPILAGAIAVNITTNLLLLRAGAGLEGVAIGSVVSFFVYGFLTYLVAVKQFSNLVEVFVSGTKLLFCLISFFGGLFLIDYFISTGDIITKNLIKTAAFLIYSVPFFIILENRTSLIKRTISSIALDSHVKK